MSFENVRILCVGDIILDSYAKGSVEKVSPEAPIPVFKFEKENYVLGGAANVARNICSGGGRCNLISVVGNDNEASILKLLAKEQENLFIDLIVDKKRVTTKKKRYVAGQQQILRVDEEMTNDIETVIEKKVFQKFESIINNVDIVVVSDYNKGLLTESLVKKLIGKAKKLKKKIVVDPKRLSFEIYKGANIITPNLNELLRVFPDFQGNQNDEEKLIEDLSRKLIKKYKFDIVLTTRSSNGMTLVFKKDKSITYSSKALEVFDVSGAGDTVVAYLSLGLAKGEDIFSSTELANKAAGVSVGKLGTASVSYNEVSSKKKISKLISPKEGKYLIEKIRNKKKIGFTNGCFDILHSGHIEYFHKIKEYCDYLIVGLNSDSSVKRIKGNSRPILDNEERSLVLSALSYIDMIINFEEPTPLNLIKLLKPDVLFKGRDYKKKDVVGSKEIKEWGGKTILIDYVNGKSTTGLIKRIKDGT